VPTADLAGHRWPDVAPDAILAVPLGSTEQHGPHLPLSTDTDVAVALCARLAAARADVLVAPPLPFGASGEHAGFAGTLSIGTAALEQVLIELVRSATDTFRRVVLVSGHGGNADALTRAVDRLRYEGRDVLAHLPRWSGDAHAGRVETSLMLALAPQTVRLDRAAAGATLPLPELLPRLRAGGVRSVSPNGVLGDPAGASADEGHRLLAELGHQLVSAVAAWANPAPVPAATP
jgi:creatinine amidohydrolase